MIIFNEFLTEKKAKSTKLFQVWSRDTDDEKFCFNATDESDAASKYSIWIRRHGFQKSDFTLKQVKKPAYANNIHNEWVS